MAPKVSLAPDAAREPGQEAVWHASLAAPENLTRMANVSLQAVRLRSALSLPFNVSAQHVWAATGPGR